LYNTADENISTAQIQSQIDDSKWWFQWGEFEYNLAPHYSMEINQMLESASF
jgi:hypothetical protein